MSSACNIYKSRTGTSDTIKMQVLFAWSSAHSEQYACSFSFYVYTAQQKMRKHFLLGFQAVAFLPHKEAEEAEQRVHESNVVGDAGDDRLLTVRTHCLNRRGLEHFSLQHCHGGRSSRRSQDGRCMTFHVDKWTGTHLSGHGMMKVNRWRQVHATCT